MPTIPKRITLTNASHDVLNVIREHASVDFREHVPIATPNAESIREIGAIIMDNTALQNEFVSALINRIGKVLVTSMSFENPWRAFKRGMLEFGETVEEVWVDIVRPQEYSAEVAETEIFKREIPDVRSAFHYLNWQKFYKTTIQRRDLELAFLSMNGVNDLIERIMSRLATSMEYDEFLTMRYLLARELLSNHFYYIPSEGAITEENAKKTLTRLRAVCNQMTFPSRLYNVAGVLNFSDFSSQRIIIDADFEANVDVNALAYAFNLSYADFKAQRILTPHFYFSADEIARLNELFEYDTTYKGISQAENDLLAKVHSIVVDKDYFMIFDKLLEMRDVPNGQGLYWNYNLHSWKLFSVSPFHNAVALVDTENFDKDKAPEFTLLDMVTGEAITDSTTLELNKWYGIAPITDDGEFPVSGIITNIESDTTGVTIEVGNNNASVMFTSFGELETDDTVTLKITYANEESATSDVGVAP